MNILVLNSGSSTIKGSLFQQNQGKIEEILHKQLDWNQFSSKKAAFDSLIETLEGKPIHLAGHRVVHGGSHHTEPVQVDEEVKRSIRELIPLAPLHNPSNLEGIELLEKVFPEIPQFAVFDTAFHRTMPENASTYPIPLSFKNAGIIRYGFHGISHEYCSRRAAEMLRKPLDSFNVIVCHLGNGSSLSAVKKGRCVNTTMGFTPLEGLMMGTRSGSVDPGILLYLLREKKLSPDQIDDCLNKESGLKGICGSEDMREVQEKMAKGDTLSQLAFQLYVHRFQECFGSMLAVMEHLDAIVFTAGIGENSAPFREAACEGLGHFGLKIDKDKNRTCKPDTDIGSHDAPVRVLVIHTREEWEMARQIAQLYD